MNESEVWEAIDVHRQRIVALLEQLTEQDWARPSLCAGWTVRDVAGHLAWQQRVMTPASVAGIIQARGDTHRMIDITARRHAKRPTAQLIAQFSKTVGIRKPLPGVTYLETLIDILVHGQDIAIPVGRPLVMSPEAAAVAATRIWTKEDLFPATRHLRRFRFTASDVDWSVGDGPAIEGPIAAILLLLTGRQVAVPSLAGEGIGAL